MHSSIVPSILDRLANETLLEILEFATTSDELPHSDPGRGPVYSPAVAISHVNRTLRMLVLSTPKFWCDISMVLPEYPYPNPSNWNPNPSEMFKISDPEMDAYKRKFDILLQGVQTLVSRAGDRPLNLRINAEPMIERLLPHTLGVTEDDENMSEDREYISEDDENIFEDDEDTGEEDEGMSEEDEDTLGDNQHRAHIASGLDGGVFIPAQSLIKFLITLSHRLRGLSVSLPIATKTTVFSRLLDIEAAKAPLLERLYVHINLDQYCAYNGPTSNPVDKAKASKLIKPRGEYHLSLLVRRHLELSELPINWPAVTHLNLSPSTVDFSEPDGVLALFTLRCFEILRLCQNLESCEITMPLLWINETWDFEESEMDDYLQCLPSLKSFKLRNFSQTPMKFAECFEFPSLEELTLIEEDECPDPYGGYKHGLMELATRFGSQVTTAKIYHKGLTQKERQECSALFLNVPASSLFCYSRNDL
jgi:hypothetical protein